MVGSGVAWFLKWLGYKAFANCRPCYDAPLMRMACEAGLGQIGRSGMVVTPEYGSRIRLGSVMTDLELVPGERMDFGLHEFCEKCGKCAKNCLGQAISKEEPNLENEVRPWAFDKRACMEAWKRLGMGCGVCLSTCPFNQEPNPELVARMKTDPAAMEQILREYEETYGRRPYTKESLPIVGWDETGGEEPARGE